jgi:hypothetical protein
MQPPTRREALASAAAIPLLQTGGSAVRRPRLAVILTEYGATSHGLCYCTKLIEGKQFDDHFEPPRCDVVAIHLKEIAKNDIGVESARRHAIPMYPSVATALCRGGDRLAVDGVALIGEHGTYPFNEKGQQLYPRRELFDQIVGVFRSSGRVVPVFNDKHLSWNWDWAKYMWRTVNEMRIPWMAGSSLPFAKYVPMVPLPFGKRLDHVVAIGYGGFESYGFHSLETGQFVSETRAGGESGVAWVQALSGAEVWKAHEAGRWPRDIAEAAIRSVQKPNRKPWDFTNDVHAMDIGYRDGHRMTVLMCNGFCQEFAFAYRERGGHAVTAASYELDPVPRLKHFSATVRALEEMYLTGKPYHPSARTTLTTGMLAYLVESRFRGGVKLETPDLDIRYRPFRNLPEWKECLR